MRTDKKPGQKADKKPPSRLHKRGVVGYSKKSALLEEAITHMNAGKYGRSSASLKELLALDPHNTEARRLFATLHLRLGSLVTARQAFESLANEAIVRQDFWLAESLLREYLAAGPRCVPFLELLAHVYEEKGDTMAAVAELGKAIDVLIEDPGTENFKKHSELYARVRQLAPASSVAFQFASFFDIQTGDFLGSQAAVPATVTSLELDPSQPQDEIPPAIEESRIFDVMPWEQFDAPSPRPEVRPSSSSTPAIESHDVPDVLKDPAPGPTGEILKGDFPGPDALPAPSDSSILEDEQAVNPRLAEVNDLIGELSSFWGGECASDEEAANVQITNASSVGSLGLSSPMPWEQIENSTIRIEAAAPSTAPSVQSEGAPLFGGESVPSLSATTQPEFISDQLVDPTPMPEMPEPNEAILVNPPASLPELPVSEVPTQTAADPSSQHPFSWTAIFDSAWKFAAGNSSSSSPSFSKPDAKSQDSRNQEPSQLAAESEFSATAMSSTSAAPFSFGDPEPLPSAHPSSEVSESIAETELIGEPDLTWPGAALPSEEASRPQESQALSSDLPSAYAFDHTMPTMPPLSEPVQLARDSEPIIPAPSMEWQPLAPAPEASALERLLSAAPEGRSAPEPVSADRHEVPFTPLQVALASPLPTAPSDAPSPASVDTLSHWSTGEVEVQPHRPSEKKRNWDKEKGEAAVVPLIPTPLEEQYAEPVAEPARGWESAPSDTAAFVVEAADRVGEKVVHQEDTRPEWLRASESISFVNPSPSSSSAWVDPGIDSIRSKPEPALSVVASAVDVLFDSTGEKSYVRAPDRATSPNTRSRFAVQIARIRIGISSLIGSCFSTTRSVAVLCLGLALSCAALVAVGIGGVGLAWMAMEVPPSSVYQNLTAIPPRAFTDSRKNGYHFLLGFDASAERDPFQAGYERKVEGSDVLAANSCMMGDDRNGIKTAGASANVVRGWFTSADPVTQVKRHAETVRSWTAQESLALRRYQQWLSMPFEDMGFGQILSPNCAYVLLAHRLYLAEGFAQDLSAGLERLETDMGSWRVALGQSKTLMVKMLSAMALQDDVAIVSSLLTRQELDGTAISRLGKMVRPLDQVELSLRWPMQSHFVWATKTVGTSLKNDNGSERPFYVALAAAMPLPVQRRFNAYADYYEAASKAVAEGRYTNLPKPSSFIRSPALSVVDYVANPIEHIIGIEPLPPWDPYVERMVETDARLRLANLQVWIRKGPQEGNVLTRLAKAGQAHYDPFTGLPMLVNHQKGVMYSVGQDGKDQEGDLQHDVVATIPTAQSVVLDSSRSISSPRPK